MTVKFIITSGRPLIKSYVIDGVNVTEAQFKKIVEDNNLAPVKEVASVVHTIYDYVKKQPSCS